MGFFFFFFVKSKPLKTSFHLFGETTSGSLNAPSVEGEGSISPSTVSCRWGLDFTAWATWQRADVFGPRNEKQHRKTAGVLFRWWPLVLARHQLNNGDTVSNSGAALTPKVIGFFLFWHVHQICPSHHGNQEINDSCSPCLYEDWISSQVAERKDPVSFSLLSSWCHWTGILPFFFSVLCPWL